jgi:hypothetical protein
MVPGAPGARLSLLKPRSWRGGEDGAEEGRVIYSCAISEPATEPVLVIVKETV